MSTETERKFMVKGDFKTTAKLSKRIAQGYISKDPARTVRIRIAEDKGYITIKGKSNISGLSRFEWEKEIAIDDAEKLLDMCEPIKIEKTRYYIPSGKHTFEVDEFHGANQGLVIAEIELESEDEVFEKPDWLGEEVTGIEKYYNLMLIQNPYKSW